MSWGAPLPPFVKIVPRLRASISITKQGTKIHLTASDTFYRELGAPAQVNVLPGVGANVGKVMIVPAADGTIPMQPFERGGGRIVIPIIDVVPADYEFEAIACEVGPVDPNDRSVVVTLPVQAWREAIAGLEAETPPSPPPTKRDEPDTSHLKPFDLEGYLRKKGHNVMRLTSPLYQIDGKRTGLPQAISQANAHRRAANLPEIVEGDLVAARARADG